MIDLNSQFFAILTKVGEAKQANADALGIPWKISQMGVGDANGTDPIPDRLQTKLVNERRRAPLNQLMVDPVNPSVLIAEQVIPADVGGWWVREIGLYDAAGDLVAVANCAPSFKPLLNQGSGRTQIVRMNFVISSLTNVELKIDPAVVLATRQYVDQQIIQVFPATRPAGTYTKVTINERGVVVAGETPSTLAGYGIKNAYTASEVDTIAGRKANNAITLAGYGIGDAYTKTQIDSSLLLKANVVYVDQQLFLKAGKATTLAGYGINNAYTATEMDTSLGLKANLQNPTFTGVPRADTAAPGTNSKQIATTEYVDRLAAGLDPWAMQPIGVPIPVMFGAAAPPKDKAYRYILLTYGDPYNAGVLTEEVITGVAPLVTSYARISLPGSPITGNTVYLLNTERRSIRPGGAGSNQDDALQNITGSVRGGIPTYQRGTPDGSFSFSPTPGSSQTGITGGGNDGIYDLTFDASRIARTSFETRVKNAGANFFMRVK